jgi:polysaccharide export outer membrane protein
MLAALAAAALLAGCSLPIRSFHTSGPPPASKQHVVVKPITPALLVRQARRRKPAPYSTADTSLQRAMTKYQYHVEAQDVLSIVIWGHPELTLPEGEYRSAQETGYIVRSDGSIFFPYVGRMAVAGKTTEQIRRSLTKALKPYVKNPQLDVKVVGFHSQKYQLAGAVAKPGLYPITNVPTTVSQAIAKVGGILHTRPNGSGADTIARPLADLAHVVLIRNGRRQVLNLRAFYRHGEQRQDHLIKPGDIIEVPDSSFDQVHLIGELHKPGNYPMSAGRLNLAQALGAAGGLNLKSADASRIFVFREVAGKPRVFWLNAGSPDTMLLATQFTLEPQDVVYVATADISAWNRVISQILPTVQTIYETKVLVSP